MTAALNLLCRVVWRRLRQGEALENILWDYPKLTKAEADQVRSAVQ